MSFDLLERLFDDDIRCYRYFVVLIRFFLLYSKTLIPYA